MDATTIMSLALLGGFLLLCALATAAFLIPFTVIATIERFSWSRKMFLEHYVWVQDTSYSGFPEGSRNQHEEVETYQSYEMVRTETTTTTVDGNTTTTTHPVYEFVTRSRTKYTYEIQQWVKSREFEAEGEDRTTYWPKYKLNHHTHERVREIQEKYVVFFQTAKGKKYKRTLPETEWSVLDDQATYILKVNIFRQILRFTPRTEQVAEMPKQTS